MFDFFAEICEYFNQVVYWINTFFDGVQMLQDNIVNTFNYINAVNVAPMGLNWVLPVCMSGIVFWFVRRVIHV